MTAGRAVVIFAIGGLGIAAFGCDDPKNTTAIAACRGVAARAGDLQTQCRACCMEHNAARGGIVNGECLCRGRAANSGLDRESQ